jgi:nicotinamidase-related amidase
LKQYRTHCGREAWDAVAHRAAAAPRAREEPASVLYQKRAAPIADSGVQVGKSHRGTEKTVLEGTHATQTVEPLAPREADLRIAKRKPSCFFGTIFMSHLNFLDIDTLIMTGCTTSGCLRATAVDAYSFNFKVVSRRNVRSTGSKRARDQPVRPQLQIRRRRAGGQVQTP